MKGPRLVSLALLALLAAALAAHPQWLDDQAGWTVRGGLAFALAGAIGAAGHGLGHLAQGRVLQVVQSPNFAWPAIIGGVIVMAGDRFL